jgi:uncharacterized RDD family membrane protein YckC
LVGRLIARKRERLEMQCPNCGLLNPPTALRCDCGYDFPSRSMKASYARKLHPPLASLRDRFRAKFLDGLVAVPGWILLDAAAPKDRTLLTTMLIIVLLLVVSYLLLADALPRGQSIGKRIMKLAVVDAATGHPCTLWQSFVRNIFFLVFGVIDLVFIFEKSRQRLGDRGANTLVITLPPLSQ